MSVKGLLHWFKHMGSTTKPKPPSSHSRIIHQAPTDRPVFAAHERAGHITTSGRRALTRVQFALPPGPEEKRRGIKGRLPIDTIRRAHNALQRASQMHRAGHIDASQLAEVHRAVHQAWPSIKSDGARAHSTVKKQKLITEADLRRMAKRVEAARNVTNENGLTYTRWCAAASCTPSPKMYAAWSAGEDPSDYRAAAQRGRAHSTMKHPCYAITMPPTSEMGSYKTRHCGPKATAREHALWDYNSARRHDGLPPVDRLPRGTKITKELSPPHGGI